MLDNLVLNRSELKRQLEGALEFAQQQVSGLIERDPDYYPMYTVDGKWRHAGELWTNWCEGFLPGMMWVFYHHTGDPAWRDRAAHYTTHLEERQHDRNVHDLNFVLGSSYGRWHRLEPSDDKNKVLITAGETMALRFKEKGQYLRSFVSDDSLFVDIMMNVGILFYSASQSGNAEVLRKAHAHCLTSRRYLVRGDGSTSHEAMFDLETGECLKQTTHQGYRGDSCWVRGLAWSLYGFGTCYRHTGCEVYRQTAEANADYFLATMPGDGISPYDFDAPDGKRPIDTSGSAIAAAGLWQLADITACPSRSGRYRHAAVKLVQALCDPAWLACETPGWEGILKDQIYHLDKGLGVGESCMFGDHFFVEAVGKVLTGLAEGVI